MPGFRVEPRALPTSVQVPECGSTCNNMGGYTHHHAVAGRVCSSVRVARKKGSSHSNIPQYDATDLRNGSEITYHDQPADRPASSHKKDLQEVSILYFKTESLVFFHFTCIVAYVCCLR